MNPACGAPTRLTAEERRLLDIADSLQVWPWEVDAMGCYSYCGPQVEKLLGYGVGEVVGRTPFEFMSPDHVGEVEEGFRRLLAERRPIKNLDNWNRSKSGELVCLRTNGHPFYSDEGEFLGYRGTDMDITAVKLAEKREKVHLTLLETLMDAVAHPIFYKGRDGVYLGCNRAFEEFLGLERHEIVGRSSADLAPADFVEIYRAMDERLFREGGVQDYETRVRASDGSERDVLFSKTLFKGPDGEVAGLIGVMLDITERKKMEGRLLQAKLEAEAANHAKSQFLARMSHELRTPFHAILGFARLLREVPLGEREHAYATDIFDSASHLLRLVDNILDVSQVESGKLELEMDAVDLRQMAETMAEMFSIEAGERGIEMTMTVEDEVPSQVWADPLRLRQVLVNLVGNALKFTDVGEVAVRIGVTGEELTFEVADTGIGVSEDRAAELLEPFTQEDPSIRRRFGGSGLGLAISNQLVKLHGGRMSVKARKGGGSVFGFTLPLKKPPESGLEGEADKECAREAPQAKAVAGRAKVLLAEDNPMNQKLAGMLLRRAGCETRVVASGGEAVEAVREEEFDIVLMDVHMPGMDGLEATRRIRRDLGRGDLPIVAVTASAMPEDREACVEAGLDDFVSKPFTPETLLGVIRRMTGKRVGDA